MCYCSNLYNAYNNNYNYNNYLFVTIRYSAHNLYVSTNTYSLGSYSNEFQTTTVLFTRNFTQDRLNSYCLPSALSFSFIVQHNQYKERSWSRTFVFSFYRTLLWFHFCWCIMYTFVAFSYFAISLSISVILILMLLLAFL